MDHAAIASVFLPKPNKQEAKADEITRNARAIMDAELAKRVSKTERLRSARMARDAQMPAAPIQKNRISGSRVK